MNKNLVRLRLAHVMAKIYKNNFLILETFKGPASELSFHRSCQRLSIPADQSNYLIINIKLRDQHFQPELNYKCHS